MGKEVAGSEDEEEQHGRFRKTMRLAGPELFFLPVIPAVKIVTE